MQGIVVAISKKDVISGTSGYEIIARSAVKTVIARGPDQGISPTVA